MSFFFNLINDLFNNEEYNQNYLDGLDYVVDKNTNDDKRIPPKKKIQSEQIAEMNHDYRQMSNKKKKKPKRIAEKGGI